MIIMTKETPVGKVDYSYFYFHIFELADSCAARRGETTGEAYASYINLLRSHLLTDSEHEGFEWKTTSEPVQELQRPQCYTLDNDVINWVQQRTQGEADKHVRAASFLCLVMGNDDETGVSTGCCEHNAAVIQQSHEQSEGSVYSSVLNSERKGLRNTIAEHNAAVIQQAHEQSEGSVYSSVLNSERKGLSSRSKKRSNSQPDISSSTTTICVIPYSQFLVYKEDFDAHDSDGSGVIEGMEIQRLIRKQLARQVPDSCNGTPQSFLIAEVGNKQSCGSEWRSIAKQIDLDLDGQISFDEYMNWLLEVGWVVQPQLPNNTTDLVDLVKVI